MVSSQHEAMHRLFQHDPGTFARAFRALHLPFPDPTEVILLSTDLTEPTPVERRADTVLRIETATGPFLLLVEAQSKEDATRPPAWAYYLSHLYAKYTLPTVLLVVCQDKTTAEWATGPLTIGMEQWPSLVVRPLVLGPHNVPSITDIDTAKSDIPLATLSAITHAKDPDVNAILKTLAAALRSVGDADDHDIFAELTEQGLANSPALKYWRTLMTMDLSFFRSETSQALRAEGRAEGRDEARAETRAEYIVRLLDGRGVDVPDQARARILACQDNDRLDHWFDRAITANTVDELFADQP
ncbi:hypothetical protein [Nocardia altamirensis]|uniref:hypothetical protein n=1 Tax=Nocardia altamirensis TaxID=472158 RepID=UPI00084001DE|nr:hypothetical protein [Nocardia altamirensis]